MNSKAKKITPFLIVLPIVITYFVRKVCSTWTGFSLVFVIAFVILLAISLVVERVITYNSNLKSIWNRTNYHYVTVSIIFSLNFSVHFWLICCQYLIPILGYMIPLGLPVKKCHLSSGCRERTLFIG